MAALIIISVERSRFDPSEYSAREPGMALTKDHIARLSIYHREIPKAKSTELAEVILNRIKTALKNDHNDRSEGNFLHLREVRE